MRTTRIVLPSYWYLNAARFRYFGGGGGAAAAAGSAGAAAGAGGVTPIATRVSGFGSVFLIPSAVAEACVSQKGASVPNEPRPAVTGAGAWMPIFFWRRKFAWVEKSAPRVS